MPDPRIIQVLKDYRSALELQELATMQDMGRRWLEIEKNLEYDINLLAEEVARRAAAGEEITQQIIWKMERYKILQEQIAAQIKTYNTWAADYIASQQAQFATIGIRAAQESIIAAYWEKGFIRTFDKINLSAVRSMIGFAGDGSPLLQLLKRDYPLTADSVLDALINGIARGFGPAHTAEMMRDACGIGLDRSILIARTELARAYRTASTEQYRQSGVTKGFMRLVKKETACPACLALDGEILSSEDELDDHPNGKCMVVPIVEGVDPPEWEKGQDWFENLDEDRQREILGPGRFDMYQEGMELADMVQMNHSDVWGDSPALVPIRDLQ